jgi:hypothetical protein
VWLPVVEKIMERAFAPAAKSCVLVFEVAGVAACGQCYHGGINLCSITEEKYEIECSKSSSACNIIQLLDGERQRGGREVNLPRAVNRQRRPLCLLTFMTK